MRERDDWDDPDRDDDWDAAEPASGVASRAVTQGFVGTAGSAWGHVETHCPGCLRHPWPDCACCGRPAIVALPDVETHHTLTLCGACWLLVLTVRMRPEPSHTSAHRLTSLQLAEIAFLREWARLTWREIGVLVGVSMVGAQLAYRRAAREACPPMLHSTPATPATEPPPSVVPKPKTRQRPVAPSISVPHPTTSEGRTPRASATPSKRKQQKRTKHETRDPRPLSAEVDVERPSVSPPSAGKYNMVRQERSTGRTQRTLVSPASS